MLSNTCLTEDVPPCEEENLLFTVVYKVGREGSLQCSHAGQFAQCSSEIQQQSSPVSLLTCCSRAVGSSLN